MNGTLSNILSIKYLTLIKGLKACSKDVSSGLLGVALVPVEPLAISIWLFQFTKGYLTVELASLNPELFGFK